MQAGSFHSGQEESLTPAVKFGSLFYMRTHTPLFALTAALFLTASAAGQEPERLPNTSPLSPATGEERSVAMVAGIDSFLNKSTQESVGQRRNYWRPDITSPTTYQTSIEPNRQRLRLLLGVHPDDERVEIRELENAAPTARESLLAEAATYTIHSVRWPVLKGMNGEGIYLKQRGAAKARVILLPDATQTPELLAGLMEGQEALGQCAHELALAGCNVVIPALINRDNTFSSNAELGLKTDISHREFIYRQAYLMGRHVTGYELQKILSLLDLMDNVQTPIGIAGYGEGGLQALYAAALDRRIKAVLVCGAFGKRENVWSEPMDRNHFGLLKEFGAAEIAALVVPRPLIIGHGASPKWPESTEAPALAKDVKKVAAPGRIASISFAEVRAEVARAREFTPGDFDKSLRLIVTEDEDNEAEKNAIFPVASVGWLRKELGAAALQPPSILRIRREALPDDMQRQERLVREMQAYTQQLLGDCAEKRTDRFLAKLPQGSDEAYEKALKPYRAELWKEVVGDFPKPSGDANPASRFLAKGEGYNMYEVTLDVWPEVQAWGYLLLPEGMKAGEKRPVVVCQHGLEGLPEDVVNEDQATKAWAAYKGFGVQLARQGFITFVPHNPYRGRDKFRVLQRKLNPLGKTLFSVIIGQHQRILEWLSGLPQVDDTRIAFYGLSYGGKSAMRIPAVLDGYCLSICSGDFNDWVRKNISDTFPASYLLKFEYEIFEWNLGPTYNYAEMAGLIAPRPFMVERGRKDGVAVDDWVASEFARVLPFYEKAGVPGNAEIEYFDGPHTINGVGTFEFLRKHLSWPPRAE